MNKDKLILFCRQHSEAIIMILFNVLMVGEGLTLGRVYRLSGSMPFLPPILAALIMFGLIIVVILMSVHLEWEVRDLAKQWQCDKYVRSRMMSIYYPALMASILSMWESSTVTGRIPLVSLLMNGGPLVMVSIGVIVYAITIIYKDKEA